MPLRIVTGYHARVACDRCGATAELCGRRELEVTVASALVPKFRRAGWHLDVGDRGRQRSWDEAMRNGVGKWFCPACASNRNI